MDDLQYEEEIKGIRLIVDYIVLNLVINGWPSIHEMLVNGYLESLKEF